MFNRLQRTLYLYWRLLSQQIKAILEYQADFFILVFAAILTQLLGIVFLKVIYMQIPDINGWLFWEVAFMYAMIYLTEGIGSLFFEGTWRIGNLINRGELDVILLRPVSPILQVLCVQRSRDEWSWKHGDGEYHSCTSFNSYADAMVVREG